MNTLLDKTNPLTAKTPLGFFSLLLLNGVAVAALSSLMAWVFDSIALLLIQ
jgi:hypothetical protein